MLEVTYKLTDFFFDKQAVADRLSIAERKAMARIGAFIRRSAQQSIRRRNSSSSPGSPPSAHSTDKVASLKNILFGYDPSSHSVSIGPVLLRMMRKRKAFYLAGKGKSTRGKNGRFQTASEGGVWIKNIEPSSPVTAMAEFGGTARATVDDQTTTLRFRPRPFMGPALERERTNGKLIEVWREIL